jgi:hypothetical protein
MFPEPAPANDFWASHATLLIHSYRLRTGADLLGTGLSPRDAAASLYHAPFVVLSHDTDVDPRFTYANLAAQARFEMAWNEIVGLPSRYSAEPLAREARARFLAQVAAQGFVNDYSGVRVTKSGRRFLIENATVWNLTAADGQLLGQAAVFYGGKNIADSGA